MSDTRKMMIVSEGQGSAFVVRQPARRSITRRRALASKARTMLNEYRLVSSPEGSTAATMRLLWAISTLERLLWVETSGTLGVKDSMPKDVARRQMNA